VKCYDSEWIKRIPIFVILGTLYCFVIPILFAHYLYRNRKKLQSPEVIGKFGDLILPYNSAYGWWEIVILSKKIAIITLPTVLNVGSSLRILICICVILISTVVEQTLKPFRTKIRQTLQFM
jgi:hypothetical protein